jgi:hypothetical protein
MNRLFEKDRCELTHRDKSWRALQCVKARSGRAIHD